MSELPERLLYGARISVWLRWFLLVGCLLEVNYRVDYWGTGHVLNTIYILVAMCINGYVHYRIHSRRPVNAYWILGLSLLDILMIGLSASLSGGFDSRYWVLYFHAIAIVALVFASMRLTLVSVTAVALSYVLVCLLVEPGLDFGAHEEKGLLYRVMGLYAMGVVVSLIIRYERVRRLTAVGREVSREREEISRTIHDTAAQSAYMVGIGLEMALQLAERSDEKLRDNLRATLEINRSAMWDLRDPIDSSLISRGQGLERALVSHASNFTGITSIPVHVSRSGEEPSLPAAARHLLFSIAHNALTNVIRHAQATEVKLTLDFGEVDLVLSVSDDGVGLPDDYADRGHGFENMQVDAERLGGRLEIESGGGGRGTTVRCLVPLRRFHKY